MTLRGARTLVTGGGGFIGANLVGALLDQGASVHVLLRPQTNLWRLSHVLDRVERHAVDLTDAEGVRRAVERIEPEVVFHLARHRGDPATLDYRAAYGANLEATLNLLEAATGSRSLRRFVHAGSSLEYDLERSPAREQDAPAPVTVLGVTKAAATLLSQHFAVRHRVPAVVLRFFTVYGPWEGPSRLVPSIMMAALDDRPIRLTRPGLRHDWIYVADVVDACLRAVSAEGIDGEILNIATGVAGTNEEMVRLVEERCGKTLEREGEPFPERPWDSERWVADVGKTQQLLGWRASTPVRDGLGRTLEWFACHGDLYRDVHRCAP